MSRKTYKSFKAFKDLVALTIAFMLVLMPVLSAFGLNGPVMEGIHYISGCI